MIQTVQQLFLPAVQNRLSWVTDDSSQRSGSDTSSCPLFGTIIFHCQVLRLPCMSSSWERKEKEANHEILTQQNWKEPPRIMFTSCKSGPHCKAGWCVLSMYPRGKKGTWQLTSVCQTRHTIVQVQITVWALRNGKLMILSREQPSIINVCVRATLQTRSPLLWRLLPLCRVLLQEREGVSLF